MKKKLFIIIGCIICVTFIGILSFFMIKNKTDIIKSSAQDIIIPSDTTSSEISSQITKVTEEIPKEIILDNTIKKQMNDFLDNFSMNFLNDFDKNNYNEENLIGFAMWYLDHNSYYKYEDSNKYSDKYRSITKRLHKDSIDNIIQKFFGFKIKNHNGEPEELSPRTLIFDDPYYYTDGLFGNVLGEIMQVTKITYNGNNKYEVNADAYSFVNKLTTIDYRSPIETWPNDKKGDFKLEGKYVIELQKESDGRFILLKFKKN